MFPSWEQTSADAGILAVYRHHIFDPRKWDREDIGAGRPGMHGKERVAIATFSAHADLSFPSLSAFQPIVEDRNERDLYCSIPMGEVNTWALLKKKITRQGRFIYHGLEEYGRNDRYFYGGKLCALDALASAVGVREIDAPFIQARIEHLWQPVSPSDWHGAMKKVPSRFRLQLFERNVHRDLRRVIQLYEQIQGSGQTILGSALKSFTLACDKMPVEHVSGFVQEANHPTIVCGIIKVNADMGSHAFHAQTDRRGALRSISERGKILAMYPRTHALVVSLLPRQ